MHIFKKAEQKSMAKRMLLLQSSITLAFFGVFLFQYWSARSIDPIHANGYYPALAEYIIGSFVIALGSALLVDAIEKEKTL